MFAAPAAFAANEEEQQSAEPVSTVRLVTPETKTAQRIAPDVTYIVAPGDTLIGITKKLLKPDFDWRYLRAVNGLYDARQLVPGQRLRIPSNWLRDNPVKMEISAISGEVKVNGRPTTLATELSESDLIETGKSGTVRVQLPDGTSMQIAPSSQVRIDRLKKYFGNETIDARIRLEQGGIDARVPPQQDFDPNQTGRVFPDIRSAIRGPSGTNNPARRLIIQTPKATAAVRGTEFRVIETDELASSAVLKGEVNWSTEQSGIGLSEGFGSTAKQSGELTKAEKLLPAPVIPTDLTPLEKTVTKLEFEDIAGAVAYRVRVARNADFTQDLVEQIVQTSAALVSSEQDGMYHIAARGISRSGVEGFDGIAQVVFAARPVAPLLKAPGDQSTQFSNTTALGWLQPESIEGYRLQIARDAEFTDIIVDQQLADVSFNHETESTDEAPRRRWWRVASVDRTGQGPYSLIQGFIQRDSGPAPQAQSDIKGVRLRWPEIAEANYLVGIAPLSLGADPAQEIATDEPSIMLTDLAPGKYEVKIITQFDGGLRSPPGQAQQFDVLLLLRDGAGNPVISSGKPIKVLQPE